MGLIKKINSISPQWGKNCFIAENATIVGDVTLGDDCSVWFQAVIRGDVNKIIIGNKVNIQDGAIVHCTYERAATSIGDRVSVGHRAIIHGCQIQEDVLVGMGAIVMDHAEVQPNVLIAAGAVVLEKSVLESGFVYAGIPAKKVKEVDPDHLQRLIQGTADHYVMYSGWYK